MYIRNAMRGIAHDALQASKPNCLDWAANQTPNAQLLLKIATRSLLYCWMMNGDSDKALRLQAAEVPVWRVDGRKAACDMDYIAVEEPLELRLGYGAPSGHVARPISITMRTPGDDVDLAVGFLFGEGVIGSLDDIASVRHDPGTVNVVTVALKDHVVFEMAKLERHFYTTSSCGVCGKTSLEALDTACVAPSKTSASPLDAARLHRLPEALRASQAIFERTGGLHAAAVVDSNGEVLVVREDVGRHNAVDKVIGHMVLEHKMPADGHILVVSGRASFELTQKALMAGIPVMAAVGAPSSLAVNLAGRFDMTLLGFVRDGRFNVYSGRHRLSLVEGGDDDIRPT